MFWNKKVKVKSEALQKLEDIQNKFIFHFQDIMVDEFEQFHSIKNNADDSSLPTPEDLIDLSESELLSFEKELKKMIGLYRSSAKSTMSLHNHGTSPPADIILLKGYTEGYKTDAERTMELAKRYERFLEEFLKSKS